MTILVHLHLAALIQTSLDPTGMHAPDFSCNIYSGSDNRAANGQNIPMRPDVTLQSNFESSNCHLPHLLSNRSQPKHKLPFHHSLSHLKKKHYRIQGTINDSFKESELPW